MSTQKVSDYLTKQLFIEKNIVTFRSLSRELRIHVNDAKNELAIYHDNAPYQSQIAFATYLLSGELGNEDGESQPSDSQDVDMDEPENTQYTEPEEEEGEDDDDGYGDDGEVVSQTTFMLVNEKDLDSARSKFVSLDSMHVYSLAPSPLHDAGLICTPNDMIRAVDVSPKAAEVSTQVGRIVSPLITVPQFKKSAPPKEVKSLKGIGTSKEAAKPALKNAAKTKPGFFAAKPSEKKEGTTASTKEDSEEVDKTIVKSKPSGRIDFAKAKPKESKLPPTPPIEKPKAIKKEPSPPPTRIKDAKKSPEPVSEQHKRGTKRKSSVGAEEIKDNRKNDAPKASTSFFKAKEIRVKKGALISDDEEDETPKRSSTKGKNKSRQIDSDDENDVTGLMDIDDEQVTLVSRTASSVKPDQSEDDNGDEDVDMDVDEPLPVAKPKKRRAKKQVPIGKNGLKKRRSINSRQTVDEKGYTRFEDYSSYESVSEEEPEGRKPETKVTSKGSSKIKQEEEQDSVGSTPQPEVKSKPSIKASTTKSKPAAKTSSIKGQPKQKSLANFFMAPKK